MHKFSSVEFYFQDRQHFMMGRLIASDNDHTMHSFFPQQDYLKVFRYVKDCLKSMDKCSLPLCGPCDQPCWLAML